MLSCFWLQTESLSQQKPRGRAITRRNAADIYTVSARTKIKVVGGYMTMGGGGTKLWALWYSRQSRGRK
jgi:hypothetical protein